jgi:hypothetical protein
VLSTLRIPPWLGPGASGSPYRRPLHTKRKSRFGSLCGGRGWEGSHSCIWCWLHLTLQARHPHCPGCHFELKLVGFTAAYRAHQCLLASTNTFSPIIRAGLLHLRGSESGAWHNRDLIRRQALADGSALYAMLTSRVIIQLTTWSLQTIPVRMCAHMCNIE